MLCGFSREKLMNLHILQIDTNSSNCGFGRIKMHIWCSTYFLWKGFCRIVSSAWGSSSQGGHPTRQQPTVFVAAHQDENHEDCLCPDINFHSKHLRNLFLIEVFYYLNPLHTTWKTCSQYWTPTLNQETLYPVFCHMGHYKNLWLFGLPWAAYFWKLFHAYQSVSHHSQYSGRVRVGRMVLRVSCKSQAACYKGKT